MSILSKQLTQDIAKAFHLGLKQQMLSPEDAKELSVFFYGLAELAQAQKELATVGVLAEQFKELGDQSEQHETIKRFLKKQNAEKDYGVQSPLLAS